MSGYIGVIILGLFWDAGEYNGNYYLGLRLIFWGL